MDAVILAGGQGNRMGTDVPKPLVVVKGRTLIDYQIRYLRDKVDTIILALGYRADQVIDYVRKHYSSERIVFSVENEPLGTAGGLRKALQHVTTKYILVINCDDVTDIDVKSLEALNDDVICVAHPQLPFGRVIEKNGYAVFEEKPILNDWVSCGWYVLNTAELLKILPNKGSLEYDVFPKLKLRVYKHEGFWKTVNTKKDIIEFEKSELPDKLS